MLLLWVRCRILRSSTPRVDRHGTRWKLLSRSRRGLRCARRGGCIGGRTGVCWRLASILLPRAAFGPLLLFPRLVDSFCLRALPVRVYLRPREETRLVVDGGGEAIWTFQQRIRPCTRVSRDSTGKV